MNQIKVHLPLSPDAYQTSIIVFSILYIAVLILVAYILFKTNKMWSIKKDKKLYIGTFLLLCCVGLFSIVKLTNQQKENLNNIISYKQTLNTLKETNVEKYWIKDDKYYMSIKDGKNLFIIEIPESAYALNSEKINKSSLSVLFSTFKEEK